MSRSSDTTRSTCGSVREIVGAVIAAVVYEMLFLRAIGHPIAEPGEPKI